MNLCTACNEDFSSVEIFDRHRVGVREYDWSPEREDGRRCLDVQEMQANGWKLDQRNRWHDPARSGRAREAFSGLGIRSETSRETEGEDLPVAAWLFTAEQEN
jgi:hypothetical protein